MTDLVREDDLSSFFNTIATAKKQKKKEIEELVSTSFEDLFLQPLKEQTSTVKSKVVEEVSIEIKKPQLIEESIKKLNETLTEPPKTKNKDPLTPLDQKFATLEDLNKHYSLFVNRIQQQLASLGGGGEVDLAFMDLPITTVTTNSYQIKHSDYYIGVNYAGAVTITLPRADRQGKKFVIKDELGEASKGTNRYITILPSSGDLVDGRTSAILAYDYGSLTFVWNNNSWRII
jgi:hypothetical protein